MQNFISNTQRRVLGATVAALLVAASAVITAPTARADNGTILVPRYTKGSYSGLVRVNPNSPEARRYIASQATPTSRTPKGYCPGTVCPQTKTCYTTKGALGAGCVPA